MTATVVRATTVEIGADEAIEALHRQHYRPLVRLAALLLGDVESSEEVVQDAFVALYLRWGRLREPERAVAYLRSAVLNGARSGLRRRSVRSRHDPGAAPSPVAAPADVAALAGDEHHRMVAALRRLPRRQRDALVLRYYLELSEAEMAAAMGVSPGSVKTHLHRGLAALDRELAEEER